MPNTVTAAMSGQTIDCYGTPWTLELDPANSLGSTFICVVRNLGTADLTIDPYGAELINNASSLVMKSGEVATITCNGTAFAGTQFSGSYKSYVYTYVTEWGEESPPSESSNLLLLTSGQKVLVTGLPASPPAGNTNVKKYRLYRTNTGNTGTAYQFVTEQDIGVTEYEDNLTNTALGEVIESTFYDPPPEDLVGIVNMANGISAGFHGNEICFSEPYKSHAWPLAYRQSVDYPIVALASVGNSLVVMTEGHPYLATGSHPENMTLNMLNVLYPCLSKRGVVNLGVGVLYPTYEGLAHITAGSVNIATVQQFTRDEWEAYNPATIFAQYYDGKYFANYTDDTGAYSSFIFQIEKDKTTALVHATIGATAGYSDPQTGEYYYVQDNKIYLWDDETAAPKSMDWQSKDFVRPKPLNWGAARIYASFPDTDYAAQNAAIQTANAQIDDPLGYFVDTQLGAQVPIAGDLYQPLLGAGDDSSVLFQLWVNKRLYWQRYVSSNRIFRLPTGYKADTFSFRIGAKFRVHAILVAETPTALERLDAA